MKRRRMEGSDRCGGFLGSDRCLVGALSVCVVVVLGLSACVNPPEGVPMATAGEQPDIPAPVTFEFDAERSYAFEPATVPEGRFRSWRGYYRGEGESGLLVPWYIEEMRKSGWTLKRLDEASKKLTFEKGNECATIKIMRELDTKAAKYVNIVEATVRPLGPEDFTVDENIGRLKDARDDGKGAQTEPARSPQDAGRPVPAPYESEEEAGIRSIPGEKTPQQRKLEEIDRYESETR